MTTDFCRELEERLVRYAAIDSQSDADSPSQPSTEIQLDMQRLLVKELEEIGAKDGGVYGYRFRGQRFDCGSKAGFLQATVAFGLARDDLRADLETYLEGIMSTRKAAE